eukprot:1160169-Pelagomonas_calceolata.AAC.2
MLPSPCRLQHTALALSPVAALAFPPVATPAASLVRANSSNTPAARSRITSCRRAASLSPPPPLPLLPALLLTPLPHSAPPTLSGLFPSPLAALLPPTLPLPVRLPNVPLPRAPPRATSPDTAPPCSFLTPVIPPPAIARATALATSDVSSPSSCARIRSTSASTFSQLVRAALLQSVGPLWARGWRAAYAVG